VAADKDQAKQQLKGFQQAYEALEKPMAAFSDHLEEQVKQRKEAVDAATKLSEWLTLVMTLAGVGVIGLLGLLVLRNVTGSIGGVQRAVDDLRTGTADLTHRLPPMKGEFETLRNSLNAFIAGLHDIVARVRDNAASIGVSSQQVEHGNRSLSARTEAQAASLRKPPPAWSNSPAR